MSGSGISSGWSIGGLHSTPSIGLGVVLIATSYPLRFIFLLTKKNRELNATTLNAEVVTTISMGMNGGGGGGGGFHMPDGRIAYTNASKFSLRG